MPPARCYVASPLGFTDAGRFYYEEVYLPAIAAVVHPVDPWSMATPGEFEAAREAGRAREFNLRLGRRNLEAIDSCSLLAAYLDGQEPDAGTVVEVGYAAGRGLRCVGLRTDLRQSGEDGVRVNLQVEAVIQESGGSVVASLEDLVEALRNDVAA